MTQSCLNHLLILHYHKDRTDSLSLTECLQKFVDCREGRTDVTVAIWEISVAG